MASPFAFATAEQRFLKTEIAPLIWRSDLFILFEGEVTQFTRWHLRFLGHDVPLRRKVTLH